MHFAKGSTFVSLSQQCCGASTCPLPTLRDGNVFISGNKYVDICAGVLLLVGILFTSLWIERCSHTPEFSPLVVGWCYCGHMNVQVFRKALVAFPTLEKVPKKLL